MVKSVAGVLAAFLCTLVMNAYQAIPPALFYDYSQPVPAGEQREDSWLDGSAVIGHSLMEGFEGFAGVDADICYFTDTGLSAKKAASYSEFELPDGGAGTLEEGLKQKDFSKVYIMLGVNEIVSSRDRFKENMAALVETVRSNQPKGTPIYILGLTPTTRAKSESSDFNLANVQKMNGALAELCEEQKCYWVDLYSCFAGEDGYLPAEHSTDGVHFKAPQYRVMADYILAHTV